MLPIHENLGYLLELMGKYDEAESEYQQALRIGERAFGPEHQKLYGTLRFLVQLKLRRGQAESAIPLAERAAGLLKGTPRAVTGKMLLGNTLARAGRYEDALRLHQESLDQCSGKVCGLEMPSRLVAVVDDLRGLGRDKQALPLLEQALRLLPSSGEAELRARLQFALAQTLWLLDGQKSRERVVDLSDKARKQYLELGRQHKAEADEVADWQKNNKLQPVASVAPAVP